MAKSALNKIIQAEKNSKERIEKCQQECDIKLQNAKISADNIIESQIKKNKQNYKQQINDYTYEAEKIKNNFEEIVDSLCCKLDEKFDVNSQKAVDAIIHQLMQNVEV